MLLIRSQTYNLLMYLFILIIGVSYMPLILWSVDGAYRAIRRFTKINKWLLRVLCGITYEIRGTPPTDACIVLSKHANFLDIIALAESVPQPKFIMKAELKWVPIIRTVANRIGCVYVNRGKKRATAQMTRDMKNADHANSGGQLIIYPQGTRVPPYVDRPYKRGSWYLYQSMGLPAHFVATNAGVVWARRSAYRYPGHVIIEYLDGRIEPGMELDEFMSIMAERIERRSLELMDEYPAQKTNQ